MSSTDSPDDSHTEPGTADPYTAEPDPHTEPDTAEPETAEPYRSESYQPGPFSPASYSSQPAGPTHEPTLIMDDVLPDAHTPASQGTAPTLTQKAGPTVQPQPLVTAGPGPVRMRTVVLGLVLLVIAGSLLVGELTRVTVDASAVLLALMIGGGLLLIAGARRS